MTLTVKELREIKPHSVIFVRDWKGYPCREWSDLTTGERISLNSKVITELKWHDEWGMSAEIRVEDSRW